MPSRALRAEPEEGVKGRKRPPARLAWPKKKREAFLTVLSGLKNRAGRVPDGASLSPQRPYRLGDGSGPELQNFRTSELLTSDFENGTERD